MKFRDEICCSCRVKFQLVPPPPPTLITVYLSEDGMATFFKTLLFWFPFLLTTSFFSLLFTMFCRLTRDAVSRNRFTGGGELLSWNRSSVAIRIRQDKGQNYLTFNRVADPDPDWIRIQSGHWVRIRNPDPDPGGQKWPTKVEKIIKVHVHVSKCWMAFFEIWRLLL